MLLRASLGFACLIGLAMTGFGIYFIALGNAARTWPEINYGWSVDGERYSGSRYQLGTTHAKYKTRTEARAAAAAAGSSP